MKKLKSLDEHNSDRLKCYFAVNTPKKSGIACPKCGAELVVNYTFCLTSNPPQYYADCPECKFHTTVY